MNKISNICETLAILVLAVGVAIGARAGAKFLRSRGEVPELHKAIIISGKLGFEYGVYWATTQDTNYSKESLVRWLTNNYNISQ